MTILDYPALPKHELAACAEAEALYDDYSLLDAAGVLQGFSKNNLIYDRRPATDAEFVTIFISQVLARMYWDRADVYPLLGRAVEALRTFGGPSESRTPRQAVIDVCGQPPRASRKALGMAIRRISESPESSSQRRQLERCIGELTDADARKYAEYVYLGRGPSGPGKGTTDLELQEGWTKGRRMAEAKTRADLALIACFPELAMLKP